jgi:hypothetical protein
MVSILDLLRAEPDRDPGNTPYSRWVLRPYWPPAGGFILKVQEWLLA